jgi:hypothetical protein
MEKAPVSEIQEKLKCFLLVSTPQMLVRFVEKNRGSLTNFEIVDYCGLIRLNFFLFENSGFKIKDFRL